MKKIRVAFNARVLSSDKMRGWTRYAVNLIEHLQHLPVEIFLFTDRPLNPIYLSRFQNGLVTVVVRASRFYSFWEQFELPRLCREYQIEVLHSPINYGLPIGGSSAKVLTIHDAISETYDVANASFRRRWQPSVLLWASLSYFARQSADKIITVSNYSKADIVNKLNIAASKISVIFEAADNSFSQMKSEQEVEDLRQRYLLGPLYFLYLGGWEKRKNIQFLLDSFLRLERDDCQLVLAGGSSEEKNALRRQFPQPQLKFLEWVEERDLPALYQGARAFVYPSLFEGFGLQIVEAMKMNCPVICSNRTSLPEVLGTGGEVFDPTDHQELKNLLEQLLDENFYLSMKEKARLRGGDFSWRTTAQKTYELYSSLVSSNQR